VSVVTVTERRAPWSAPELAAVAGAVVALVVASSATLSRKGLFMDEGFSVSTSLRPWDSLVRLVLERESNGILYSLLLKPWSDLGPGTIATSEAWLRLPSLGASVATVLLTGWLAARWWSPRIGAYAAVLTAAHGSVMAYSQQIRAYAFVMAAAVLVMAAFEHAVRVPSVRRLAMWGAAAVVATTLHVLAPLLVPAGLAALLVGSRDAVARRRCLATAVVVAALLAPVALALRGRDEGQSLHGVSPGVFWDVVQVMSGRGGIVTLVACIVLGSLGAAVAVRRVREHDRALVPAITLMWLVVPGAILLVLIPIQSFVIGRYLLMCLPAGVMLMAVGLDRAVCWSATRRDRRAAAAVLVVSVAAVAGGSVAWLARDGEDFRGAVGALIEQSGTGDRVVFANDSVRLYAEHYVARAGGANATPSWPPAPWGQFGTGDQSYLSFDAAQLDAAAPQPGVTWVLVGRDHENTEDVDAAIEALPGDTVVTVQRFAEGVELLRIERRG
jgi:4-amino-4-deoxy-L-arabinose transferase-like glycosyltransferase